MEQTQDKSIFNHFIIAILITVGIVFFVLAIILKPEPLAILVGSGSVKNYISRNYGVDIERQDSLPKYVYISIPTVNTWALLKEEMARFDHTKAQKREGLSGMKNWLKGQKASSNRFLYISLSADSIDQTVFEGCSVDNAKICGYCIGYDTLVVYVNQGHPLSSYGPVIDMDRLKDYIDAEGIGDEHIYITSKGSGTLRNYEQAVGTTTILQRKSVSQYTDKTQIRDAHFMVLGSQYYYPKMDEGTYDSLILSDYSKPLFLYFVVHRQGSSYAPAQPVIDFIESYLHQSISHDRWQRALQDTAATVVYLN